MWDLDPSPGGGDLAELADRPRNICYRNPIVSKHFSYNFVHYVQNMDQQPDKCDLKISKYLVKKKDIRFR